MQAAAYFCPFITTESEERPAVTSPRTISMRYKSCKVNSFSQVSKIFFYIKIVIKGNSFLIFAVEQERGGGVKMINYLLVATAILKISKIQIKFL